MALAADLEIQCDSDGSENYQATQPLNSTRKATVEGLIPGTAPYTAVATPPATASGRMPMTDPLPPWSQRAASYPPWSQHSRSASPRLRTAATLPWSQQRLEHRGSGATPVVDRQFPPERMALDEEDGFGADDYDKEEEGQEEEGKEGDGGGDGDDDFLSQLSARCVRVTRLRKSQQKVQSASRQ